MSSITASPVKDIQLESYPSARLQHFMDMLKENDFTTEGKSPCVIVMNLGIDDLVQDHKNLYKKSENHVTMD